MSGVLFGAAALRVDDIVSPTVFFPLSRGAVLWPGVNKKPSLVAREG